MSKKENQDGLDLDKTFSEELTRAESFIKKNGKTLSYVIAGLVIAVGAFVGYQKMILAPQEAEAQEYLFVVQNYFESDSFNKVINGNGTELSALDIIDDYGMTKAANLAHFYAGFSYLNLKQYEDAIDHLESFDSDDMIIGPKAVGGIGDAHSELGNYEDAASKYMKAANMSENEYTTPLFLKKAGLVYEKLEQYDDALKVYTRIKEDYKDTEIAQTIKGYIARVEAKMGEFN